MNYKIGQRHTASDEVKDYLTTRPIDFLQKTKQFYNYNNKLDVLERAVENARAAQAQGGYEALLERAQKPHDSLASVKPPKTAKLERTINNLYEAANKEYLSVKDHDASFEQLRAKSYQVTALGAQVAYFERTVRNAQSLEQIAQSKYALGQKVRKLGLAAASALLGITAILGCGNETTVKNIPQPQPVARQSHTQKSTPVVRLYNEKNPEPNLEENNDVTGNGEPHQTSTKPTTQLPNPDVTTPSQHGTRPAKNPQEEQPEQPVPQPKIGQEQNALRAIEKLEYLAAENFTRGTANAKLLANLDDNGLGLSIYGQFAKQEQDFSTGTLDGDIVRAGVGLYKYWGMGSQEQLFSELALWYENRSFDFENGLFEFGNNAAWVVGKFGHAKNGSFDQDNPVVDSSLSKLLVTLAYGTGSMTGDVSGDYKGFRGTLEGHFPLNDDGSVKIGGGIAYQNENLGRFGGQGWENKILSAEAGPVFDLARGKSQLELKTTWRKTKSDFQGSKNNSTHWGGKLGFKSKLSKNIQFLFDLGHERDDGGVDGLGTYGQVGIQIKH